MISVLSIAMNHFKSYHRTNRIELTIECLMVPSNHPSSQYLLSLMQVPAKYRNVQEDIRVDSARHLVIMSHLMVIFLTNAKRLFMDGTFKVRSVLSVKCMNVSLQFFISNSKFKYNSSFDF